MHTQVDSYHDLPEPAICNSYFYIDQNQFDGDDDASEKAAFDADVNRHLDVSDEKARAIAKRLAVMVGHRVHVQVVHEFPSGRCEFEQAFTVMPWNQ